MLLKESLPPTCSYCVQRKKWLAHKTLPCPASPLPPQSKADYGGELRASRVHGTVCLPLAADKFEYPNILREGTISLSSLSLR